MNYLSISPITLGTVQFGIPYGLKENARAASQDEVDGALTFAVRHGITCFDTAAAYGDSEEKIGKWIEQGNEAVIITKILGLDKSSEKAVISSMRNQVLSSKQRLHLLCLTIIMVHRFNEYFENKKLFDKAFSAMKEEGHIRYSGISAYATDDYFRIADSGLDSVQIPLNILDWEKIDLGGLQALPDAGLTVFARSIYVQGLLLRTPATLPLQMLYGRNFEAFYNTLRRLWSF